MKRLIFPIFFLFVAGLIGSILSSTPQMEHWRTYLTSPLYRKAVTLENNYPSLDVQGIADFTNPYNGQIYRAAFIYSSNEPWTNIGEPQIQMMQLDIVNAIYAPWSDLSVLAFVSFDGWVYFEIDCPTREYLTIEQLGAACVVYPVYLPIKPAPQDIPWVGRHPYAN